MTSTTIRHITTISQKGLDLIKEYEGYSDVAYQDDGGLWTIGYGTTVYPDTGIRVKQGDTCTRSAAETWLKMDVAKVVQAVDALTIDTLNQNQLDALVCLSYNIGTGQQGFQGSTLRRLVNSETTNPVIGIEWTRWHNVDGRFNRGLYKRRCKEASLYFTGDPNYGR